MKNIVTLFFMLASTNIFAQKWAPVEGKMMTSWGEQLSPDHVWQEYPRPQFERSDWMNLNGLWDYSLQSKALPAPENYQGQILVPFCVESALSGVGKEMTPEDRLWYKRKFKLPAGWDEKHVVLNFEAVDYNAAVWINGAFVGTHKGGFDRFSFDITPYIKAGAEQQIVVAVDDPTSADTQPRGKQRTHPYGITYTPVSGIWQTVWLEAMDADLFLNEVKITPDIDKKQISIIPIISKPQLDPLSVKVQILFNKKVIHSAVILADRENTISIDQPKLWSPESPALYDVSLSLMDKKGNVIDMVDSYFGMRKISLGDVNGNQFLFLNNEPLFHTVLWIRVGGPMDCTHHHLTKPYFMTLRLQNSWVLT